MTRFGPALARLRRDGGFATPYAFYHRSGGRRVFPFTFQYYLKIESGRSVPRPDWVPVLISALRVPPSDSDYRALVTDYLKDLCGSEEAYEALIAPLAVSPAAPSPAPALIRKLMYSQAYALSIAQLEALAASEEAFWVFEYLCNTDEALDAAELARRIGYPQKAVAAAFARLTALKLVRRASGRRYKGILVARRFLYPTDSPVTRKARERVRAHIAAMAERSGGDVARSGLIFRSTEANVRAAAADVKARLEQAQAGSLYEAKEGTAIYFLDFRARRALSG
ncbi:hypothetical protein EPO15_11740 [bacterium]|nr:MAG: hypothetical protein EPO15_11740 [bacterium]